MRAPCAVSAPGCAGTPGDAGGGEGVWGSGEGTADGVTGWLSGGDGGGGPRTG